MKTLLKYDFLYMKKTSKILVFLVLGVFLSGLSVLTARYLNDILKFAFEQEGLGGIVLPDVTVMDAYVQFHSNFQQIFFFVLIFVGISFINHDASKGYDVWILSRPVKRYEYLLSKTIVLNTLVFVTLVVSAVVFAYYTYFIFDEFAYGRFSLGLLMFMVFTKMFTQIFLLLGVIFRQTLLPVILSFVLFFTLSALSAIEWSVFKYLPGNLLSMPLSLFNGDIEWSLVLITMLVATVISIVCFIASVKIFETKQIS